MRDKYKQQSLESRSLAFPVFTLVVTIADITDRGTMSLAKMTDFIGNNWRDPQNIVMVTIPVPDLVVF